MSENTRARRFGSTMVTLALAAAFSAATLHCSEDDADNASSSGTPPPSGSNTASPTATERPPSAEAGVILDPVSQYAVDLIAQGRQTFRYDTFGDEEFWGGTLKLHRAINGEAKGGVGDGVAPKTALAVGLKVDVDALPAEVIAALKANKVDLDAVDTTLALLKANAVVGVTGFFDGSGALNSLGIQCAFCHATVDDSFAPGIGHRLDGWPNRDLDVGAIVNLSPDLTAVADLLGAPQAAVRDVLAGWGPGRYNAEIFLDGKALGPDGKPASAATLLPPAFGMGAVNLGTFTGFGSMTYWNAFVANLEMHGKGTFIDSRLADGNQFPVAADAGFSAVRNPTDLITSKLAALQFYQLAIAAPTPPAGSFDAPAAARGKTVFEGQAKCASCHVPPIFTEPGWNMHTAEEIGIDDFQSSRAPDRRYRTTPLKGLFAHSKGGFYHDGRFATLEAVVDHYDTAHALSLTVEQKADLVQYLKSL